jgi:hypothetical protein
MSKNYRMVVKNFKKLLRDSNKCPKLLQYGQKVQKLEHNGKKCYKTTA